MKFPGLLLSLILAGAAAQGQGPAAGPESSALSVLEQKWERVFRNPALEEDPFEANDEQRANARQQQEATRRQRDLEAARREGTRQQVIRASRDGVLPPLPTGTPPPEISAPSAPPFVSYVYRAKVRNDGPKTVRAVVWEYVFADPETKGEVGRHRHTSAVRIAPGKSAKLSGRSPSPPARVVRATSRTGAAEANYVERVEVRRVEYDDGSAWERP